jgi:glycosyltransferase involved in cell wall biosynthesis
VRVAVVHNLGPGGARRRLEEQVRHLAADVIEVCLATAMPLRESAIRIPCSLTAARLPRPLRPPARYSDFWQLVLAWSRVGKVVKRLRPDVVFANSCRFLHAPPALRAFGVPSLYFCDEARRIDYEATAAAMRNTSSSTAYYPLYRMERRLDRASVAAAGSLATVSNYSAAEITRAYDRDATVVGMGVREDFRPGSRLPVHLLSVGALIAAKGHADVIRVASLTTRRWPVLIVAPRANPSEESRLRALGYEIGVDVQVRVAIPDAELVSAYQSAQATLYLSRGEPLGLASLEAQACGSPAIVAKEGGLPETVIDGRSGWVVPGVEAAAICIDALDDRDRRAEMSRRAAEHGAAATWKRSAEAVLALLEAVARRSEPR